MQITGKLKERRHAQVARGKKTSTEDIYNVIASWASTGSYSETARDLNMPQSTVEKIVKDNKDKPEFVKLCDEKKKRFAEKASSIIDKGMLLLERRLARAIESEEALDILIDEIFASDKKEISHEEKKALISKVRALELYDIKALTTAIGTLYDKRALSEGAPTERVDVIAEDRLAKLAEIAGYERK